MPKITYSSTLDRNVMENWIDLLNIIPEPFRFIILILVAVCISYFCAKILAGVIISVFKIKLLSENNGKVSFGLSVVRKVFRATWLLGILLVLYLYYSK